jgi:hypothetical protein
MLDKMADSHWLYQETVVIAIRRDCGPEFVYTNESGNPAIDRSVLREFRKLTEQTLIWERGEKAWRRRKDSDKPTRQQDRFGRSVLRTTH